MRLDQLIQNVKVIKTNGDTQVGIEGIQYDSRKVKPGDCFVCIRGFSSDGRVFAPNAVAAGAVALVYDETNNTIEELISKGILGICVESCREALGHMSSAYYSNPSKDILMVGVTGTNGKTSVTHLLIDLMEQLGKTTAVFGTIANRVADEVIPAQVTTPESLELNIMLDKAREKGVQCCAMEVSSHAVALHRIEGLYFDYGIFTNFTKDHLDFHETMEAYFEAKKAFFEYPKKGILINTDDPYGQILADQYKTKDVPVTTFGIDAPADLRATELQMSGEGTAFKLNWSEQEHIFRMPIPGKIYVYNVLAAISVLLSEGYSLEVLAGLVAQIKPLKGRLEPVENALGISVLIDYAHTPDGLANAIKAAKIFTKGKMITVFGCGGDRDKTKRPQMGAIAGELSDYIFVTSDNPRTEVPRSIINDILPGLEQYPEQFEVEEDRSLAIGKAIKMAVPGDTVLIAGKGHETYQIIGTTRTHFDDKEEVQRWLMEATK